VKAFFFLVGYEFRQFKVQRDMAVFVCKEQLFSHMGAVSDRC